MHRLAQIWWTAKGVGWENVPRRLLQAWRVRSGSLRRRLDAAEFSPERFHADLGGDDAAEVFRQARPRFFSAPSPANLEAIAPSPLWAEKVTAVCEKALAGEYLCFGRWYGRLGWPPDFGQDARDGYRWPAGGHWMDGGDSLGGEHDMKLVWEASRFSLAYFFARQFARGGQQRWSEAFWRMLDAWLEQNPAQASVAWRCGQEMTFRLMAMLTGAMVTLDTPAAAPARAEALLQLAWRTGKTIEININQALMQGNNHGISEAVGLWTVGVLFPRLRPAAKWRRIGLRHLANEAARQVYDDGSYVQHSFSYHRVMMDDLLWACRLAELSGETMPPVVLDRLGRATEWLAAMIDPLSGRVPNYGANDGAQVLPLSCCDYLDYRPVAQAAWYLLHRRRLLPAGPWDEKMLWLFGAESLAAEEAAPARAAAHAAEVGGYYILRGPHSWAMTRCHGYRHRPGQADMLHVDLWREGVNVLRDGGSYMYNCPQPWRSWFVSTAAHNTVQLDRQDQMTRGPRFLWFNWTRAKRLRLAASADGRVTFFQGELARAGQGGGCVHRRMICRLDDGYIIVDDVLGQGRHDVALRWRLCEGAWRREADAFSADVAGRPWTLELAMPPGLTAALLCGQEAPAVEGWESLYYAEKSPSPTVVACGQVSLPVRIVTLAGCNWRVSDAGLPGQALRLTGPRDEQLAQDILQASGGNVSF